MAVGERARGRAVGGASDRTPPPSLASPADPDAAARRLSARHERVTAGLDDLDRWLGDQVSEGIARFERLGYAHFDLMAARMVDAQAPGVASLLRSIPAELASAGWPPRVLERLAGLHLLIRAHRRLDQLSPQLAATVRSRIGYPVSKDGVRAGPGIHDDWLAVGAVDTVESRLQARRVWLWGTASQRWAQWLTFAAPGQSLDSSIVMGRQLIATLHFYPGAAQYRALVTEADDRRQTDHPGLEHPAASDVGPESPGLSPSDGTGAPTEMQRPGGPPAVDCAHAQRQFAALVSADPWADRMPVALKVVITAPDQPGEPWQARDDHGARRPLVTGLDRPWPLLAQTVRGPATIFGEWSTGGFRPLSVLADDHGRCFTTAVLA